MVDTTTPEFYEQNREFVLQYANQEELHLGVIEVKRLGEVSVPGNWGEPETDSTRQQFSVIFRGPSEPHLPQAMYRLIGADSTVLDGIFLVPIAQDSKGLIYEAVFT